MRVFLALQIPSQTTIGMIKDYCNPAQYPAESTVPDIKDYEPMIEYSEAVGRLVDIMDGSAYKSGKHKDVELIDSPDHKHIERLIF